MNSIFYPFQLRWMNDQSRLRIMDKGRQVGISWATAYYVVMHALDSGKRGNWKVLSASERQSKDFARDVIAWLRAIDETLALLVQTETGQPWEERQEWCPSIAERVSVLEITLRNGKRIAFLPANPDTARGGAANVVLDEYAFHKDGMEILKGVGPSIARGYELLIISTPNGKQGSFHDIYSAAQRGANGYSAHFVPTKKAIEQGADIDYGVLCNMLNNDPDAIAQELEGVFLDTAAQFLPPELIAFAESDKAAYPVRFEGWKGPSDERAGKLLSEATGQPRIVGDLFLEDFERIADLAARLDGDCYFGFDVARDRDLIVQHVNQRMRSEYLNSELPVLTVEMSGVSFASQKAVAEVLLAKCRRGCIDATGIGRNIAEDLRRTFGEGKVEEITFTNEVKAELAWRVRNKLQDTTAKIPAGDNAVRAALRSVKKIKTSSGNDRFDADRSAEAGHADYFWALALALHAGSKAAPVVAYRSAVSRALGSFFRGRGSEKRDEMRKPPAAAKYHKRTGGGKNRWGEL